jgi:hypothetical protein
MAMGIGVGCLLSSQIFFIAIFFSEAINRANAMKNYLSFMLFRSKFLKGLLFIFLFRTNNDKHERPTNKPQEYAIFPGW